MHCWCSFDIPSCSVCVSWLFLSAVTVHERNSTTDLLPLIITMDSTGLMPGWHRDTGFYPVPCWGCKMWLTRLSRERRVTIHARLWLKWKQFIKLQSEISFGFSFFVFVFAFLFLDEIFKNPVRYFCEVSLQGPKLACWTPLKRSPV